MFWRRGHRLPTNPSKKEPCHSVRLRRQASACGRGFALIDPHGDLAEKVAAQVASSGRRDVIYLNPADPKQPYGYSPLRQVRPEFISLAASGLIEVLKKMWADSWGVRMEHILRNVLLALLEQPGMTLQDVLRLLSEQKY